MLDLSPTKLLIIFVVVVVLLGPKRLPEVARQLGAGWRKLRDLHLRFDQELRQTLPDLPSSRDIVRFARSPVSLLDQLADRHESAEGAQGAVAAGLEASDGVEEGRLEQLEGLDGSDVAASGATPPGPQARPAARSPARSMSSRPWTTPVLDADDPNLN